VVLTLPAADSRMVRMRIAVRSLGCKVNQAESDSLVGMLAALEPEVVELEEGADLVVINTCSVTTTAEATARKEIRRARRANPQAFVVVTGCYAELAAEQLAELGADAVVPNRSKAELPRVILEHYGLPADPITTPPNEFWGAGERGLYSDRVRAFIKVQDGCNAGCAYCIIPLTRGRERHRDWRGVVEEAEALAAAGYRELVLTGVRLGSYSGHPRGVSGLLEELVSVGVPLRLSSMEPEDTGDELLEVIGRHAPFIRPHLHLSLQSGSDRLLELMGRRYDTAYYRDLVNSARKRIPGFALTTDVIAGLPTETADEHRQTLDFLRQVRPSRVHVFTYTPRPKTRAARLPQVEHAVRKRRTRELITLAEELAEERMRPLIGGVVEVLVEKVHDGLAYGHTPDYYEVEFSAAGVRPGENARVRVERVSGYRLLAGVDSSL